MFESSVSLNESMFDDEMPNSHAWTVAMVAQFFQDVVTGFTNYFGARIIIFINAVPKAH